MSSYKTGCRREKNGAIKKYRKKISKNLSHFVINEDQGRSVYSQKQVKSWVEEVQIPVLGPQGHTKMGEQITKGY